MKSFKEFLLESDSKVVVTFGRFNPPTIGHEKLFDAVASAAKSSRAGQYKIFASQSTDAKKNPLEYKEKIKFLRKMFPSHARNIVEDNKVKTLLDALSKMHDEGFTEVVVVVGSDRVSEFNKLLNKFNGVKSKHGFYEFDGGVNVLSAGERDPDSDDVSGMSASKMRTAASQGDFDSFSKGLPSKFKDASKLYNLLRKRMGVKEEREHIQLEPVSDIREQYVQGKIFNEGDKVKHKLGFNVVIKERCVNHIITNTGKSYFINDLQPI
jgi:hypothetical protein